MKIFRNPVCLTLIPRQKAAMDALLVVATLTLLWGPVHLYLTKTDVAGVREWISFMMENQIHEDPLKETRAEEEMLGLVGI